MSSRMPTGGGAMAVGSAMAVTLMAAEASEWPVLTKEIGMIVITAMSAKPRTRTIKTSIGDARMMRSSAPTGDASGFVRALQLNTTTAKATSAK